MIENTLKFHEANEKLDGQFILQQPNQFLAVLADAVHDKIAFYAHDLDGCFTYLGRSTKTVLNLDPVKLRSGKIQDILSDNPINDKIRDREWLLPNSPSQWSGKCEIVDLGGSKFRADLWRIHVYRGGSMFSVAGILRRSHSMLIPEVDLTVDQARLLFKRVALLSEVEREVIEMAVDGIMNKRMATLLDVAVRTIESRRARAMSKLQAKTLTELVQVWMQVRRLEAAGYGNSA